MDNLNQVLHDVLSGINSENRKAIFKKLQHRSYRWFISLTRGIYQIICKYAHGLVKVVPNDVTGGGLHCSTC
jgi:hypothetical protein